MKEPIRDACILIVDDELLNVRLLEVTLEAAGYRNIQSTTDSRQALPLFISLQPDLLLLDLNMPYLDGFTVMQQLEARIPPETYFPILVLTANVDGDVKRRALGAGAKDFLTKPFDRTEVLLRIENLLQVRFLNTLLEHRVSERTQELELAQLETLQRLALAAEYRDDDTGLHTRRVGHCCARIAEELGLSSQEVDLLQRAAPLHDVGKIGVPDSILLKPGKLTAEEFEVIKQHTVIGAKILSGSRSPWLQMAEEIALTHHERWDGCGYARIEGDRIPLVGRIVAVADVFDALTHERPYKKAWSLEDAVQEIKAQSGQQFDPQVVEAFLKLPHAELVL